MTTALNILLEITVYSAVLCVVILLFQKAFHKAISAAMNYAVWGILILRLLVPVTIDSGLHLFIVPETPIQAEQSDTSASEINVKPQTAYQPIEKTSTDTPFYTPANGTTYNSDSNIQIQPAVKIDWQTGLVFLWAAGAIGSLIYVAICRRRLNKKIERYELPTPEYVIELIDKCKRDMRIKANIRVSVQGWIKSPALSSSIKPKLLIPEQMLESMDEKQIEFGIRHELTHYRRKDHLVNYLLVILRCVYWFNPVVYFAFRRMQVDMETACDADITSGLESSERSTYIRTMIDLGGSNIQYVIGMGICKGRKAMEKRIRGIFMKKRTGRGVRTAAAVLAALMLMTCFTTACQPTPSTEAVVGKKDGLSSLIQATSSASSGASAQASDALYTKLNAPKHWSLKTTALDGKLNITADANIELPGVPKLPAATAKLSEFKQEDLDKIAKVLGVGGAKWTQTVVQTKEHIEQVLIEKQRLLAEYKAEDNPDAELIKDTEESIEYSKKQYTEAPSESELKNIDFKIGKISYGKELNGDDIPGVGFEGSTQIDGQQFFFSANNAYNKNGVNKVYAGFGSSFDGFGAVYLDAPRGVSITKEKAAQQAGKIAKQLTDDLTLCYVTPAATAQEASRKWGWACVFMREINGCPTAYESTDIGASLDAEKLPITYEKMIIVIDDKGMVSFTWQIPMTIDSIDNPDVSLLSFDKISQRATEQISHKFADEVSKKIVNGIDESDPGCTANIKKVALGLMRINKLNSDDYYYIPVWKFFIDFKNTPEYYKRTGYEPFTIKDSMFVDKDGKPNNINYEYQYALGINVITINALDGSNIDNSVGY